MRVVPMTVSFIAGAIAAWVFVPSSPLALHFWSRSDIQASSGSGISPEEMKRRAGCMFRVLSTISGIMDTTVGYVVTSDGWTHPFVQYKSESMDWYPVRFDVRKSYNGRYTFVTSFSGPIPPGFDEKHFAMVIQLWKSRCHESVDVEIN